MLPNLDQALYRRFKKEGYRMKSLTVSPVSSISELVQLAYLDVNRTIRGIDPGRSQALKQLAVSFIERLLADPPTTQADFDQRHHECCQECLAVSAPVGVRVHYGQAQKLLNMSLKYLYNEFATYKDSRNHFRFPDTNVEHFFHLPIDSQIRDHLVGVCGFADPTSLPWSQWRYDQYIGFQHQLRKRISPQYRPLEIDYLLWNTKGATVGNALSAA